MNGENQNPQVNPKGAYIRTMQEDIESLKKGVPPTPSAKEIEVPSNIPTAPEISIAAPAAPTYEAPQMPTYEPPGPPEIPGGAMPEMAKIPEIEIPEEKKLNLPLILGISGIAVVLIVGGIAAYFLLFKKPIAVVEQPPSEEALPPEETLPTAPTTPTTPTTTAEQPPVPIIPEPSVPKSIIFADFTQTVNLNSKNKDEISQVLKNIISSPKEVGKVNNILLKVDTTTEKSYLSMGQVVSILGVVPAEFTNLLGDNSQLFGYTQEGEQKLGFIAQIKDSKAAESVMLAWENKNKMLTDLAPIMLNRDPKTLKPASATFKDNTYLGVNIRYLNLPTQSVTLDYAIVPDKNLLIFSTSKDSMFKIIELVVRGY